MALTVRTNYSSWQEWRKAVHIPYYERRRYIWLTSKERRQIAETIGNPFFGATFSKGPDRYRAPVDIVLDLTGCI